MGSLEVNRLIVESINDKYFIAKLIEKLNINIKIDEPLNNTDELICLDGIGNLKIKLITMKLENINKLGIILDADCAGIESRLGYINSTLKNLKIDIELDKINEFKKDNKKDLEIASHILNVNGKGELEDILYSIKTKDATFADCLNSWRECLKGKDKKISDKDFLKFQINNYIRFDTCSKEDKKQMHKNCDFKASMQKDIWDFDHENLDSLKEFLRLFNKTN
ncbi:MAG: hypothetical protein JJV94_08510 [Sulfurospirillum sp.]|nr:hypothetical protein [Sulfurospirillum sp.]